MVKTHEQKRIKMDSQAKPTLNATPPQRSRRSKVIGSVVAVAAMAGLGGLAWYLTHQPPATGAPGAPGAGGPGGPGGGRRGGGAATTVGVATAEKADIPVTLEALGTVTAAATTTVRPQVSGILQKVLFKEGQMVKAGQVLAQIDPRQFEMSLLQASGQRQRDEAQLENAKLTLNRFRTLLTQDSIARQDVDTQAALVKQLEGTVMTDRAAEGSAKLNLGYTKVIAPITGRVGLRVVDIGNLVSSGDSGGIAVITQLSPIDVEFSIPQDSVPGVMQRVNDGAALPAVALDRTRTNALDNGKFAAMDNQIDVQTGTVKAKARFDNAKSTLFPSQFVNVRLELRTIKDAVMVPVTAVRHGASGDFVYLLKADKTVTIRPVVRGQATVDKVQITSGLQVGEQVITEGADRLKEGARVTLPGAGGPGGRHGAGGAGGAGGEHAGGAGGWKGRHNGAAPAGDAAPAASAPASASAASPAAAAEGASAPAGERRHRNKEGAAQQ
jgi:multidrug efflux system membrane fusion protein